MIKLLALLYAILSFDAFSGSVKFTFTSCSTMGAMNDSNEIKVLEGELMEMVCITEKNDAICSLKSAEEHNGPSAPELALRCKNYDL